MDALRRISLSLSGATTRTKHKLHHHLNPTAHGNHSLNDSSDDDEDHMLVSDLWKKAKLNQHTSLEDDGERSQIQIKDLRARRVYSPQSVGGTVPHSTPDVDPKESRVGSRHIDLEMVENNGRSEVSKRDDEIDGLGERLPSESRNKDEINSILSSIAKEYLSEKDGDLCSDGALKTTNKETESPVVGFPYEDQNMGIVNHESVGTGAFERLDSVNGLPQLNTPPDDIETCGKVKADEDGGKQAEAIQITDTQLTGNTDGKAEESFCANAGDKNDSLRSKHVLRPRLQRKLFKSPGSVSYRRLLPFIMNMIKDDSGASILGHPKNDGMVNDAKQFQFPLSTLSQETLKDQLRTDSRPRNDDEFRVLAVNSDSSGGNESKLTSNQDLPESPKQLNAKEVVHDCSSVPSVNGHIEINLECSSTITAEEVVDVQSVKEVATSVPSNVHGCKAEAIGCVDTSEKLCVVNQQRFILPDADICGESKNAPCSTDVVNTFDSTPSNQGNAGEGFCTNALKGKDTVLRSKSVLKPCLQGKLFKTPGSVSYKRLLPFLKDIARDDCGVQKLDQNQKDKRDMRSQPPLLSQSRESPTDERKTDTCPMHDPVDEANAIQDSTTKDTLFNGDCDSGCSPDLLKSVAKIDSPFTSSSPITNGFTPGEHPSSVSLQLSVYTEAKRDNSSNGEMHHNANLCCQKLQKKTFERHTTPTVGLKKGILKRNPRGCRGLCTCLNCASFRLHAEKAFEFSRNLFLDAEDVALDLMNELSHLRSMLERRTNDANNHSVLDENEVKEACRKAFAAEQLAKERLCEMNDDVNIHCRITSFQPPRVKFANYIEEKVISPGRLSEHK